MAGHSQNRMSPSKRSTCPQCKRKGLGSEQHHFNAARQLVYFRRCRFCQHTKITARIG